MNTTFTFLVKEEDAEEAINRGHLELTTDGDQPYFPHLGYDYEVLCKRVTELTATDLERLKKENPLTPAGTYVEAIAAGLEVFRRTGDSDELDKAIDRYRHRADPHYPDCTVYNLTKMSRRLPDKIKEGERWFAVPVSFHALF